VADRVLRGSRLGAVSYETDRNHAWRRVRSPLHDRQRRRVRGPVRRRRRDPGATWAAATAMEGTCRSRGGDVPAPKKV